MAQTLFFSIMLVAFIVAFFASVTGAVSAVRLLMHLRKLDPSTYEQVGGQFLALFGGKPAFRMYLGNKSYLESTHEPIRIWGKRFHFSVATLFASVAIGLVSSGLGHLTIRWSSP